MLTVDSLWRARHRLAQIGKKRTGSPRILVVGVCQAGSMAKVLRFLLRRVDATALAVVVTCRDDELGPGHPTRPLLGDLAALAGAAGADLDGGHGNRSWVYLQVDILTGIESAIEIDQHFARAGRAVGFALDLNAVAARGDIDAEPVLDRDQVAVILAEKRSEQIRLLELDLEAGAGRVVHGAEVGALGH